MADQSFPLTPEHCQCLDRALHSCALTEEMIRKCEAAGLDMSQYRDTTKRQQELARGLKAQFFPTTP